MFCLGGDSAEASSQRRRPRKLPHKAVQVVCFSFDAKLVATSTRSRLAVWDLERNKQVAELEHSGIDCVGFCNNLGTVLVGGSSTGITVFEWSPEHPPSSVEFRKPAGCLTLDVSRSDSGVGVFGLMNGMLHLFHCDAPGVVTGVMRDQGPVCSVSLNRTGTVLVSCTNKTRYSKWDTTTLQLVQRVEHQTWVWACVSNSLGSRFISCEGRHSCTLRLWDANATDSVVLPTRNDRFEAYAVSADFSRLVFSCAENRLVMLCVETAKWSEVFCFPVSVQDVCLSPTTSHCAVGLANGLTFVLDLCLPDKSRLLALVTALRHILPTEILRLVKSMLCWKGGGGV
ncbi:hypothetical protein BASA81_012348 [Batrachochytrium salamandrivorans]|nr:hypothetical protein BASA81_012348 [Batrachochytrium salamandrivorans]